MGWPSKTALAFVVAGVGAMLVTLFLWWWDVPSMRANVVARRLSIGGLTARASASPGLSAPLVSLDFDPEFLRGVVALRVDDQLVWPSANDVGRSTFQLFLHLPVDPACAGLALSAASDGSADGILVTVSRAAAEAAGPSCPWSAGISTAGSATRQMDLTPTTRLTLSHDSKISKFGARVFSSLLARKVSAKDLLDDVHPFDTGEAEGGEVCLGDSIDLAANELHIGFVDVIPAGERHRHPGLAARTYATSYSSADSYLKFGCLRRHLDRRLLKLIALLAAAASSFGAILGFVARRSKCT